MSLATPPGTTAVTHTPISSTAYNAMLADVSNEISDSLPTTGVKAMEANLPMGGSRSPIWPMAWRQRMAPTKGQIDAITGGGGSLQPLDALLTDISDLTDPGADRVAVLGRQRRPYRLADDGLQPVDLRHDVER